MNVVLNNPPFLQVDPLRSKTYGAKKPLDEAAEDKVEAAEEPVEVKYYPKNKKGAVDEWVAMEQQKQRAIEALNQQKKEEEKAAKKQYK